MSERVGRDTAADGNSNTRLGKRQCDRTRALLTCDSDPSLTILVDHFRSPPGSPHPRCMELRGAPHALGALHALPRESHRPAGTVAGLSRRAERAWLTRTLVNLVWCEELVTLIAM